MARPLSQTADARRQRARARRDGIIPLDAPDLSRPRRPCARCRKIIQPTTRRRLLCTACFRDGSTLVDYSERRQNGHDDHVREVWGGDVGSTP